MLCCYALTNFEREARFVTFMWLDVDRGVVVDYHFVLQVPVGASAKFGNDGVAVAEHVDVEVDVGAWLIGGQ